MNYDHIYEGDSLEVLKKLEIEWRKNMGYFVFGFLMILFIGIVLIGVFAAGIVSLIGSLISMAGSLLGFVILVIVIGPFFLLFLLLILSAFSWAK